MEKLINKKYIVAVIMFVITILTYSEECILKSDFKNLRKGNFYLNKKSGFKFALLIGTAFAGDEKIREIVQKNRNKSADNYFMKVNDLGHPYAIIPIFIAGYGSGLLLQNEELKQTAISSGESAILSCSIVMAGKFIIGRERPYMNNGSMKYKPLLFKGDDYYSFPSGHSAIAWALATPYAEKYSRWIYIIPASVSFARVYKDKHWSSDVMAGSIIGFVSGYAINRWKDNKDENFVLYPNGFSIKY
jgi:hypothetical protein